ATLFTFSSANSNAAPEKNFFTQNYTGTRADFTGNVGYEFVPETKLTVTALGRSVSGGRLQKTHQVTLWDTVTAKPLATATATVSMTSKVDALGYAFQRLAHPLLLAKDHRYRITSSEMQGGDPMMEVADVTKHAGVATVGTGVYGAGAAYPSAKYGGDEQGYGVPTFYFDTAGVKPALLKAANHGTAPLIRDIPTGYLLQCSFLSPRPYCWQGTDSLLSGWEVDKSGGNYAFHPTCLYPDGFAFHSDWFKLMDTNTGAAVTLKHQIARQTTGQMTLEFRFKMTKRMDGARWQLRDLQQSAMGLVTAGGNLCWENGKALAPYEINREYGVKVIANIAAHTADVFVDGSLKAKRLPFVHSVKSLDYFLVKTGGTATGEMFLSPVNIYKGYAVNETFVASGVGKAPADWSVHNARVLEFECGTKPDIFSLKVTGAATKQFTPAHGRMVFECRFLLPVKANGARIDLGGVKLPELSNYRPNLWYMAKVITNPGMKMAEIFINGKPTPTRVAWTKPVSTVRFAGNLWVDDVQVYPWRDYPADYVPAPKPTPAKSPYALGVQSCNLWREGTAYAGWDYVYPYRDKRKPYLGWYDEGSPEETDWEIKWQVEHGVTFEQHCWYRPNNAINHPIKDGVLDQGIIKGLFNARYSKMAKFTIMCTDEGACETNPQDWRDNIIPYWIEYFFKDPRYFKVNGKPVVSIYSLSNWQRMFGSDANCRQAISALRVACKQAGFPGVIVLMEHRGADRNVLRTMKDIGVDDCYSYTWGTPDVNAQRNANIAQRDAAASVGFHMLPSISMGWDREAWGVHDGGWATAADYQSLAQWTKDQFMPSLPADSLGRHIVMLANWNEFGEGHFLMPSTLTGFGYLDALRTVFTPGGAHHDAAPNTRQKRRFTAFFPKD
ncbi:MAG: hypothetical protein JWQ02_3582, partial [Capsulimonas sp.]|nr:hypothetical protein [Capsulimonas sp.]